MSRQMSTEENPSCDSSIESLSPLGSSLGGSSLGGSSLGSTVASGVAVGDGNQPLEGGLVTLRSRSIAGSEDRPPLAKADAARVLVVDDEPEMRRAVERLLKIRGVQASVASDGLDALKCLESSSFDVVLVDLFMPNMDGMQLLQRMKRDYPDVEVIMMTAHAEVATAVRAVQAGAHDFITKPFRSDDEVALTISKAAEKRRLIHRNATLERELEQRDRLGGLIGNSATMRRVYDKAVGVASTVSTVLILGESGTGKELTARAIHQNSDRKARPFVPINCSAIPVNLIESELFGHVRGAFTGAVTSREGVFEMADKGTIFLDEVGDLPLQAQVKLLRTLQEGEIKRVGSSDTKKVDVRVIAATNVNLLQKIADGHFREDLYYRLAVICLDVPPLRERTEDIPALAYHFLNKYAKQTGRSIKHISSDAMLALCTRPWPGNVRELENAIEHAVVFTRGDELGVDSLPDGRELRSGSTAAGAVSEFSPPKKPEKTGERAELSALFELPYREAKAQAVQDFDVSYFTQALSRSDGNISEAARLSGLDRSNFRRSAKKAGVHTSEN